MLQRCPPAVFTLGLVAVAACLPPASPTAGAQRAAAVAVAVDSYRVVKAYPHDPTAYTQGLIFRDGFLYESTGLHGRSTLRKVKLETGEVLQQQQLAPEYFAEGLAESERTARPAHLAVAGRVRLRPGDPRAPPHLQLPGRGLGAGSATAGGFILSDGSAQLRFLDPETFREVRRVTVTDGRTTVDQLNELEMVNGEVWANVWHTNRIVRISPKTGEVTGWIDLTGLMAGGYRLEAEAVLNGIAYDAASRRLFVTGKLWPKLFEIAIVPRAKPAADRRPS